MSLFDPSLQTKRGSLTLTLYCMTLPNSVNQNQLNFLQLLCKFTFSKYLSKRPLPAENMEDH